MSGLGGYLRSSRARVDPAQFGIATRGVDRRVPGLRRIEVASAAGVSVDYYTRLEQGRERSPSPQVLDALADALRLGRDGRTHLFRLAGAAPRVGYEAQEVADPALVELMHAWDGQPAMLLGRSFDVLALNPLGAALLGGFDKSRNFVEALFVDAANERLYVDWPAAAAAAVDSVRLAAGQSPPDPRLHGLVDRLRGHDERFAALWERNLASSARLTKKTFRHPSAGTVTFGIHAFDVRAAPGQELVLYRPEDDPGTRVGVTVLQRLAGIPD